MSTFLSTSPNPFWKKLGIVVAWSLGGSLLVGAAYRVGFLDWYVELKQLLLASTLFTLPVAVADVITGATIWGVGDVVGQYLAKHPARIDRRQTALVAGFGVVGGLGTHVLLNIPDALLPVLAHSLANQLLRTLVVLTGGLALTLLFTNAESRARERFRIETYHVPNERWKAADVVAVKLFAAPVKTFIVINLLPISIRVLTEQLWDYLFMMMAAYFMNRDKPLIVEPIYSRLSRLR
ncbi:MAG: hypothetical protein V3S55_00315 [Nitrospiraceae bacterium]